MRCFAVLKIRIKKTMITTILLHFGIDEILLLLGLTFRGTVMIVEGHSKSIELSDALL